ncbi:glutamate-cysteine ligase [Klebsormidium nitens]|uniref:Glutamate--cysteine ligase n=1 Tax=Klebsormidium nitens TaxID=105231 RepID=A0A1Y1IJY6_KLENI|nr:glutamate-cysteine ligase [Klebsormidium nitens]|eukprot:GAQ88957.1 glutamate-cysteine ligase [Klebsormidium nitens]
MADQKASGSKGENGEEARLTKQDLVDFFKKACTPRDQWRIGTEHEKIGFRVSDKKRLTYEEIRTILGKLADKFGWERSFEHGNLLALKQNGASITLEPGGQLELSGAPFKTLHETLEEVNNHISQVKAVCKELGAGFLTLGFDPKWTSSPTIPKERHILASDLISQKGEHGHDVMYRTCTVQVNLDYESEQDMVNKMRVGLALQPIATALFANSPFYEGKPSGFVSYRSITWTDTDPDRTGMLPFVFDDDFGFEKFVDWALDVPMYYVQNGKEYVKALGLDFKDFMAGKLEPLPGKYPTMADWLNQLNSILSEVRLKNIVEMRGSDNGPPEHITAQSALWVGLLYDDKSLQAALQLIKDWTAEERDALRNNVPRTGLKTVFRGTTVQDVAQKVVQLAKEGLERRGLKEEKYVEMLEDIARTGMCPADKLLDKYHNEWGQNVDKVYSEHCY